MSRYSILILFILFSLFAGAQIMPKNDQGVEAQYEQFEKEFLQEFGEEKDDDNQKAILSFRPSVTLQDWLFVDDDTQRNRISYGISDPGLDSLDALEQATLRALAMASFAGKSKIQNVSDNYYLEHAGSRTLGKFNSFTTFQATDTLGYKMLQKQFTSNGEMILKIKADPGAGDAMILESNLELFQSETTGMLITRVFLETEAQKPNGEKLYASWMVQETPRSIEIESTWNGQQLNLLQAKFKYRPDQVIASEKEDMADFWFDMKYGLWYAYINAMAVNMEQMEVFDSQVKFLDENFDDRFQDLTRVVFSETVSFRFSGIKMRDNQMSIKLEKF